MFDNLKIINPYSITEYNQTNYIKLLFNKKKKTKLIFTPLWVNCSFLLFPMQISATVRLTSLLLNSAILSPKTADSQRKILSKKKIKQDFTNLKLSPGLLHSTRSQNQQSNYVRIRDQKWFHKNQNSLTLPG